MDKQRLEELVDIYTRESVLIDRKGHVTGNNCVIGDVEVLLEKEDFYNNYELSQQGDGTYKVLMGHDEAKNGCGIWGLPYEENKCCGVQVPKKMLDLTENIVLFTPTLEGCSIHILEQDNSWLFLHDARNQPNTPATTRYKDFSCRPIVSYEYTMSGYHFVYPTEFACGKEVEEPESEIHRASVLFYYSNIDHEWFMVVHGRYGRVDWKTGKMEESSEAGEILPVSLLMKEASE